MVLALLAAPAAGQTPLVDVPASADGPVHLSAAGVARGNDLSSRDLMFAGSVGESTGSYPQVMGRGFRLVSIGFSSSNTWSTASRPALSATELSELAVVAVGPSGTTPRVWRLSDQTSSPALSGNTVYYGPASWGAQALSDLNTYTTASDWTVLVVDHTDPDVHLDTLTYGTATVTPPPPPPPAPSRVTGVRVSPRDGALHVSWSAAAGEVSQYRVDAADASGKLARRVYTDTDVFEALVDGLANGVDYTVTVTALTSHPDVEGPASEPRTVTPLAGAGDTGETPDPVPALPLAGAGVLTGLLTAAAVRRLRSARRRA